jgi:hypothetical protein
VISRGLPSSQPVRTRTWTGSTRIIAMNWLLPAESLALSVGGALRRQNVCSVLSPP